MEREEIEKLLIRLRAEVHAELTKLDEVIDTARLLAQVLRIQAENARNVAFEALAEIRYIRGVITTAATAKPSPETPPATASSKSRGRRL